MSQSSPTIEEQYIKLINAVFLRFPDKKSDWLLNYSPKEQQGSLENCFSKEQHSPPHITPFRKRAGAFLHESKRGPLPPAIISAGSRSSRSNGNVRFTPVLRCSHDRAKLNQHNLNNGTSLAS
ncbi:hypothetical protein K0M31_015224 [Melipona bicolor]|uniref:Uncharacterized protein n=1 Tax=Melipona bicolor TaxID=60889 RepID=A0AA40FFQ1_9HYME|nr:hypothetical protein K0M31_015224 [Melipona bicolor]